jgi:hypothetical protein
VDQSWQGQLAMRRAAASIALEDRPVPEPISEILAAATGVAPGAHFDPEAFAERVVQAVFERIAATPAPAPAAPDVAAITKAAVEAVVARLEGVGGTPVPQSPGAPDAA